MRLSIVLFTCLLIVSLSGCKSPEDEAEQSVKLVQNFKPNVIFIFADDLGWGDLSCYGNSRIKTPSLDRLAVEGTLFTQFYVAGSVCSPSRAGIMTGQYPARNRVFGHFASTAINERRGMPDALDPDIEMLTDILKGAGYTTAHFGKWHLGNISPAEYGVDAYRTNKSSNLGGDPLDIWSAEARPTCTRDILDETFKFIEQEEKPFYVNVWLSDVHATLNPSKEQMDRVLEETNWIWPPEGIAYTSVEQVYLASLLEMDRQIGLFIDKLEALGIRDNSLIIFSSDNGPEDFQLRNSRHSGVGNSGPFRGRKRSIYEGGIRVPFILSWPGKIPAGKVNDQSVLSGVDFLPTLACITGAKAANEQALDGEDMSEVWLGSDRKRNRELFWEWRFHVFGHTVNKPPMIAVREGDYKLLINPDNSRVELYNILNDPGELNNLARQEAELVKLLSRKARTWFNELPESPWDETAGQNAWNWPQDGI